MPSARQALKFRILHDVDARKRRRRPVPVCTLWTGAVRTAQSMWRQRA